MEAIDPKWQRTALLLGEDTLRLLSQVRVLQVGIGGVGSWCAEALVRTGVQHLDVVDNDVVSAGNVNRQLMATAHTIGQPKTEALRERLLQINPEADIRPLQQSFTLEHAAQFDLDAYDYVIDAIDTAPHKTDLILTACRSKAAFFSSMGAALKLDPTRVRVAEFWKVQGDPLAASLRRHFRKSGNLPARPFLCVYSDELRRNRDIDNPEKANGSLVQVTAVFGFTLASLVVGDCLRRATGG